MYGVGPGAPWGSGSPQGLSNDRKFKEGVSIASTLFCSVIMITGCVLLPIGLNEQSWASKYNPTLDFVEVNGGCMILNKTHSKHESYDPNEKKIYCVDRYFYLFYKREDPKKWRYRSEPEDVQRKTPCDDSDPADSIHLNGETATCWEPVNHTDVVILNDLYDCGNVIKCIKLRDPALEHASTVSSARVKWILGACLLSVGGAFTIGLIFYLRCVVRWPQPPENVSFAKSTAGAANSYGTQGGYQPGTSSYAPRSTQGSYQTGGQYGCTTSYGTQSGQ